MSYEANPADLKALVAEVVDGIADETDPLRRYALLSASQALYDALVSEIKALRGGELRRMADGDGCDPMTYPAIAEATGLGTKQRVAQLISPPSV